ncbi:MAG: hypothetical protein KDI06_19430 [Calditrichaeota bacterium]|nr:hypothetical protein [Calditrichota bacterium]HQU72546.1 hypothetical protein [Calditrichia bacterium]
MEKLSRLLTVESVYGEWSRRDSEELVMLYLNDYYHTLDEYYLREAIQLAKDDGLNFEQLMREVRYKLS